jgi:hypothetical protein
MVRKEKKIKKLSIWDKTKKKDKAHGGKGASKKGNIMVTSLSCN